MTEICANGIKGIFRQFQVTVAPCSSGRDNAHTHTDTHTHTCRENTEVENRETAGNRDKEVSVVENMQSDIKAMQLKLFTFVPEMHG